MPRPFAIMTLILTGLGLAACSQASQPAAIPPLYVPSVAIAQSPNGGGAATNAYSVLPESDSVALWVPRQEKWAWGPYVLQQASAYSVFTYDQQRISDIWGPSYRYRWITQSGVTVP